MIIWGGEYRVGSSVLQRIDGASYDPATNSWTSLSSAGSPDRISYSIGNSFLVNDNLLIPSLNEGVGTRYDVASDTWLPMSSSRSHVAIDSYDSAVMSPLGNGSVVIGMGSKQFVWGNYSGVGATNTGAIYDSTTDEWIEATLENAPSNPIPQFTKGIWTGNKIIIWDGNRYSTYTP